MFTFFSSTIGSYFRSSSPRFPGRTRLSSRIGLNGLPVNNLITTIIPSLEDEGAQMQNLRIFSRITLLILTHRSWVVHPKASFTFRCPLRLIFWDLWDLPITHVPIFFHIDADVRGSDCLRVNTRAELALRVETNPQTDFLPKCSDFLLDSNCCSSETRFCRHLPRPSRRPATPILCCWSITTT